MPDIAGKTPMCRLLVAACNGTSTTGCLIPVCVCTLFRQPAGPGAGGLSHLAAWRGRMPLQPLHGDAARVVEARRLRGY